MRGICHVATTLIEEVLHTTGNDRQVNDPLATHLIHIVVIDTKIRCRTIRNPVSL